MLDHFGLNHLTWIRGVKIDGEEVLPRILEEHGQQVAEDIELPVELVHRLGMIPSYYLRYYYAHDVVVEELRHKETRASAVATMERQLLEMYADPTLDHKPELLAKRGGAFYSEAAVNLLASLVAGTGDVQVANVRNNGTMPFLADDAVIEVPAVIGADGAVPLPVAPVPALQRGLIAHVTAYEELALTAAVHGGRERVFEAMLAHPLIGQYDQAERLTDLLLSENKDFLAWT